MSVPIIADWRELYASDGSAPDSAPMEAYWARPRDGAPGPGVVVLMEVFGVNAHICAICERLAGEGYSALAVNYYHRTTPNRPLDYSEASLAEGRAHKDQTTAAGLLADVQAAIAFLQAQPETAPRDRVGVLGFSFGGHAAFLAATLPEVAACVSFCGGGIPAFRPGGGPPTLTDVPRIGGELLCLFGDADPLIPPSQVEAIGAALRQAGVRHEIICYAQAGHGFHRDGQPDFKPDAARDAWRRTLRLFQSALGPIPRVRV
ncbi:MAG: dienelactone hydrolase family protein [Vampirovibrionales bacterium]|nr:dienelactone hydrolase family protein [Vampirovibrionales bacterium]